MAGVYPDGSTQADQKDGSQEQSQNSGYFWQSMLSALTLAARGLLLPQDVNDEQDQRGNPDEP